MHGRGHEHAHRPPEQRADQHDWQIDALIGGKKCSYRHERIVVLLVHEEFAIARRHICNTEGETSGTGCVNGPRRLRSAEETAGPVGTGRTERAEGST